MTLIYEFSKVGDELPKTTIEFSKVGDLIVQPKKYWFDYVNNVIIRKCNLEFDPKPYILIQGPTFQTVLISSDKPTNRFNYLKIIIQLSELYQTKYKKQ